MGEGKGRNFIDGNESVEVLLEMVLTQENPSGFIAMICLTTKRTNPATFNQFRKELKSKDPELYSKYSTVLDLNHDKPKVKGGCFIATATMGDYNHPIVLDLRDFRDYYLLNNIIGRRFVKIYYFLSPSIAKLISKSELTKSVSLKLLIRPLHKLVKKIKK